MFASAPSRKLLRGGSLCLVVGALASLWHFFSQQSPSSPFYPGTLPGPVRRFAFWALASGVMLVLSAILVKAGGGSAIRRGRLVNLLVIGTVLKLGALFLGALLSVYGIQIIDPRPSSVVVMSARMVGEVLVIWALVGITRDLFARPDPSGPGS